MLDHASGSIKHATPRRGQVQDEVLRRIRKGLMIGAFVPGQVMSLRKLASKFGHQSHASARSIEPTCCS